MTVKATTMKKLDHKVARPTVTELAHSHSRIVHSILLATLLLISFMITCNTIVGLYGRYILNPNNPDARVRAGIVFGAGITDDGRPFKELQARLDSAADALENGTVEKLLLSGDNRLENYNEPDAMIRYLVESRHIEKARLQPDYAGRSTYETCERAQKIFGIQSAVLFSATSHLPRAIYTCRSFGIESYGIGNNMEANNASRREFLARVKAVLNNNLYGEGTLLGSPIAF